MCEGVHKRRRRARKARRGREEWVCLVRGMDRVDALQFIRRESLRLDSDKERGGTTEEKSEVDVELLETLV